MGILGSLGLGNVESNPNHMPDNKYRGVIKESRFTYVESKNTLNHVIVYQSTEGATKGKVESEWWPLGTPHYEENPEVPGSKKLVGLTPTMSEKSKTFYKKRLESLGTSDAEIDANGPESLVAMDVEFTIVHRNGYQNIGNAWKLGTDGSGNPATVPVNPTADASGNTQNPWESPAAAPQAPSQGAL
jgi:hypothetical protein